MSAHSVPRQRSSLILTIVCSLALLALLPSAKAELPQKIRIGLLVSLTGNWASPGDMIQKGIALAIEDDRSAHPTQPLPVELVVQDTDEADSGAKAISAYRYLRAQGLTIFVGPAGTPGGLALAPIAAGESILMISPSVGVGAFHKAGPRLFNAQGSWAEGSRGMARHLLRQGLRRAAVVGSEQPWETEQANEFADEFVKGGGTITTRVDPMAGQSDLRTEMMTVVRSKPEVIFFGMYNQIASAARFLKSFRYEGRKAATFIDHSRLVGAEGGLDGAEFIRLATTQSDFQKKFHEKYKVKPDYPADFAYDSFRSLLDAIRSTSSVDPDVVAQALLKTQFDGAAGRVEFDSEGCMKRTPGYWRVKGEEFVAIAE